MSQRIITGGQRQGKTYFCVCKMISYLLETDRHIYTNLPVYPDIIAKKIVKRKGHHVNHHNEMIRYLSRIHIIRKFPTFDELRDFRKKSPLWCGLYMHRDRNLDYEKDDKGDFVLIDGEKVIASNPDRLFYPIECILEFWKYKRFNSIIMLDEIYNYFNALDYRAKGQGVQDRRLELLKYSRQHGHDKDDIYFISHHIDDIDSNLRKGNQYTYKCYCSLYQNMLPADILKKYPISLGWLRGLKHLKMFFIVEGYERDNDSETPDDYWRFLPDKSIFACYNSFSKREGSKHKQLLGNVADSSGTSSDINKSKIQVLKEFLFQAWLPISVLLFIIFFIYGVYCQVYNIVYRTGKVKVENTEKSVVKDEKKEVKKGEKVVQKLNKKPVKLSGITSNSLYYDDGYRIEKGGIYEGFEIVEIGRVATVVKRDGKEYRVSTRGIRTETEIEQKQ